MPYTFPTTFIARRYTPLEWACATGDLPSVQLMLARGADASGHCSQVVDAAATLIQRAWREGRARRREAEASRREAAETSAKQAAATKAVDGGAGTGSQPLPLSAFHASRRSLRDVAASVVSFLWRRLWGRRFQLARQQTRSPLAEAAFNGHPVRLPHSPFCH